MNQRITEALHVAVCQAVALLNRAPEVARCAEGREARDLLRQALADYADAYMDKPVTEHERATVATKHQSAMLNAAPSPADQPHHLTIAEQRTLGRALHKSVRFVDGTDQPSDWRPIESAPRDGTDILLSNGRVVAEGHWLHAEPYVRENRDLEGRYVGQDESDGHDGWIDWSGGMQPEPTTWMPLPPPPAEKP